MGALGSTCMRDCSRVDEVEQPLVKLIPLLCPSTSVTKVPIERVSSQVAVVEASPRLHIEQSEGVVLLHDIPDYTMFSEAVDTCSGIGVLRDGVEACGIRITATNELREVYCQWQCRQGREHIVQGDLGDPHVLAQLHRHARQSHMLLSGFSCQPWSRLGDHRKLDDQRASALHKALFAAFHLRSHSVVLECVTQAGEDKEVVQTIQQFCRTLNFRMAHTTLRLEHVMPARRSRWWALLTHATMPPMALRDLPVITPTPTVGDLLPIIPVWTPGEVKNLSLDQHETRMFQTYGGLDKAILRLDGSAPTALHGWGNQLTNCSCGCRQHPLSEARLEAKGLHGALILTEGSYTTMYGPLPKTRHVHPWELSVLNGALPDKQWSPNLRLDISGLGQMASPIQSCWIVAQFQSHFDAAQGNLVTPPETKLWQYMQTLFSIVQEHQPAIGQHPRFQQYVQAVQAGLQVSHFSQVPQVLPGSIGTSSEDISNSQRLGRQHPWEDQEMCKQPATGPQAPEKRDQQPAEQSQELQNQPATGTREPQEDMSVDEVGSSTEEVASHSDLDHPHQITQLDHHSSSEPTSEPMEEVAHAAMLPQDCHGGLAAFATHQAVEPAVSPEVTRTPTRTSDEEFASAIAHHEFPADEAIPMDEVAHTPTVQDDSHNTIMLFRSGDHVPAFVKVPKQDTVGMVTVAEDKLRSMQQPIRVTNALGVPIPLQSTTSPLQQVFLEQHWVDEPPLDENLKCPSYLLQTFPHRAALLYHQKGWVADDEMWFYLQMLQPMGYATVIYPCLIQPNLPLNEQAIQLMTWLWTALPTSTTTTAVASVFALEGQWIPILVVNTTSGWNVYTVPVAQKLVIHAFGLANIPASIVTEDISSVFRHDCGFQAVQWLAHQIADPVHDHTQETIRPISVDQALEWRIRFEFALHYHGHAQLPVEAGIRFFAGGAADITDQLVSLLTQHGVPPEHAGDRANTVIEKLGRGQLQSILRSATAWRDLKALANAATPKLQLVMGHELQQVIQQRAKEGKPFGSKKSKNKTPSQPNARPVVVAPEDVSIPGGIFQDANHNPVQQINIAGVTAGAKGIALATVQQASSYLKYPKPLSKHGLALLVLDHHGALPSNVGTDIRFPARCEKSGEPIILGAKLLQLGSTPITRIPPAQAAKIDEVANAVIRIVVFRDEWEYEWQDFISRPVKSLVDTLSWLAPADGKSPILECWDRQFLTFRLQKSPPSDADLFCVNVRVDSPDMNDILGRSGQRGIYAEPRTPDGRAPAEQYRVIWINKSDKMAVTLAGEATSQWTSLVRSGQRYGLRVLAGDAAQVHQQHKPDLPWLDATQMQTWVGGPFPYGATRASLTKLFGTWSWSARPVQAKGRSPCGKETMWWIQATNNPKFEVYHMDHADVLLTPTQAKDDKQMRPGLVHAIQASPNTMKLLTAAPTVDPLQVNDPWQSGASSGPAKMPRMSNPAIPDSQVDAIVAKVEQRIQANLPKQADDGDVTMDSSEAKVQCLEERLAVLEQTVQSHHTQQTLHNQKVSQEVTGIRQQVTDQATALHQHFDSKMGEQLKHIEELLNANKARKTEYPIRPLVGQFPEEHWQSARILTVAAFCDTDWVKIGIMYGFAHKPKSAATREASDQLLQLLVDRLAFNQYGYRVIMGDFNQSSTSLQQFEVLRQQGWAEIQEYGKAKWGREIQPTCRNSTTVDQLWLSPELLPLLEDITVDPTVFADHATVHGTFASFGRPQPFYVWPRPHKLDWETINLHDFSPPNTDMNEQKDLPSIFADLEDRVDTSLRIRGKPGLLRQQKGRCTVVAPKLCQNPLTPIRPSRPSEYQITYLGESYQHMHWGRQLRRLQSLCHLLRSPKTTVEANQHRHQLWDAIKGAIGFPGGFRKAWTQRTTVVPGCPLHIPHRLPSYAEADKILQGFTLEFQALEKLLNQARLRKARTRRVVDRNIIFRDVAKPRSLPVQTFMTKQVVQVQEVSGDGLVLTVPEGVLQTSHPVFSQDGLLQVASITSNSVQLESPANLEVGSILLQEKLHGWSVHSSDDLAFRRMLMTITDTTADFFPVPNDEPVAHLFTDGSCLAPNTPCLRLATWSVVLGVLHDQTFHPVSAGGVPGGYQTVLRAEIMAAISACKFSLRHQRSFCLWTDNDTVFKFVRRAFGSPDVAIVFPRKRKDHDLWNEFGFLCHLCIQRQLFQQVFKVTSHQTLTSETPEVERWAFAGNEHADRVAVLARGQLPPGVMTTWERFSKTYAARVEQARWLRQVFIEVGQRAIAAKDAIKQRDGDLFQEQASRRHDLDTSLPLSFQDRPADPDFTMVHTLGDCHEELHRWMHSLLASDDGCPAWVSSHQLLALFQQDTGYLGVKYVAQKKGYIFLRYPQDHDGHGFVRIAAWLMAAIKCWGRHYDLECHTKDTLPWGSTFKTWTRCVRMLISPARLRDLDQVFYNRGLSPVTKLTRQLGDPGEASADSQTELPVNAGQQIFFNQQSSSSWRAKAQAELSASQGLADKSVPPVPNWFQVLERRGGPGPKESPRFDEAGGEFRTPGPTPRLDPIKSARETAMAPPDDEEPVVALGNGGAS
eukprot:Skav218191  [mRNA]  locus=scaffold4385:54376:81512:+ [translate_table: standard]